MELDVRRLRVLREVARRGTLASAADALAFTPSAVSQQLRSLEREAGVGLLEKDGRSVRLTDAAWTLVRRTDAIVAELERARSDLDVAAAEEAGTLDIAAFATGIVALLAPALTRLRATHPAIETRVTEVSDGPGALAELPLGDHDAVLAHEYDFRPLEPDAGIERVPLLDEPMLLVRPPGAGGDRIADFADHPWACAPLDTDCGQATLTACRGAGFEPAVDFQGIEFDAHLAMVAAGLVVALVPRLGLTQSTLAVDAVVPTDHPIRRRIFAAVRRGTATRPAVAALLTALTEVAGEHEDAAITPAAHARPTCEPRSRCHRPPSGTPSSTSSPDEGPSRPSSAAPSAWNASTSADGAPCSSGSMRSSIPGRGACSTAVPWWSAAGRRRTRP